MITHNADEDEEKLELLIGMQNCIATIGNCFAVPFKTKNELTI